MDKIKMLHIIRLPFWETVRRSFGFVFGNPGLFFKVTLGWYAIAIFEIFTDFPTVCNMNEQNCANDWAEKIAMVLISFASIAIVIAYCRVLILNMKVGRVYFSFGRRGLIYLVYNIALLFIIAVPSAISIAIVGYVLSLIKTPDYAYILLALLPLIFAIIGVRLFLVLPAIAVDNKQMTMRQSFRITKGNGNKIFWGQVLMSVPMVVLAILMGIVFQFIGYDSWLLKLGFVLVFMILTYLDAALKASFYAHIYQYFMYYSKKKEE